MCVCCCWCFFNVHSGQTSFYGGLTNFLPHLFRMNTLLGTYVPVRDACPLSRLSVTRAGCRRIRETFLYYFVYTRYIGSCVLFSVSLHRLKWVVWSFSCQFTRATRTAAEKKSAKRFGTIWFAQFTLVRVFFCLSVYTSYSGSCGPFRVNLHRLRWLVWSFPCQFTQVTVVSVVLSVSIYTGYDD